MSKSSHRRPAEVSKEEFDQRWEDTFGPSKQVGTRGEDGPCEHEPMTEATKTLTQICIRCGIVIKYEPLMGLWKRNN
jgi:hypothetical protein